MKKIKTLIIVLAIILISLVSFAGVFIQTQNRMENKIKNYNLGKELSKGRVISLTVSDEKETVIKDSEGKIVEDAQEEEIEEKGYTKEEVPVNTEEVLNTENYEKVKTTIINRLNSLNAADYSISLNKENGTIRLELADDDNTDMYAYYSYADSKLEMTSDEDGTELLTEEDIKSVEYGYSQEEKGYQVTAVITLSKDGQAKLADINSKYAILKDEIDAIEKAKEDAEKKDEESKDDAETKTEETEQKSENSEGITWEAEIIKDDEVEEKTIATLKINGTKYDIVKTDDKTITINVGSVATTNSSVQNNLSRAAEMKMLFEAGLYPVHYELTQNEVIYSSITDSQMLYFELAVVVVLAIVAVIAIIKYRAKAILAVISYVGFIAIYLLVLRYANTIITIEGIGAILLTFIINIILNQKILNNVVKHNDVVNEAFKNNYKEMGLKLIPLAILTIIFCFIKITNISSFGMVMFWGLAIVAIYNVLITRTLLKLN